MRKRILFGGLVGSVVGIVAAMWYGTDGWVLGGAMAGAVVGRASPDLAAALFHGAGAGALSGLVFAIVFGLGTGIRFAVTSGNPEMLPWGVNPFFSIGIVYGFGCAVVASIVGGVLYGVWDRTSFVSEDRDET